jgi:glycine/D-amino acid oxidase-like deaminating enzyme
MAADRADLVVVGAGTVGGWAPYFARLHGAERVIVIDRGRAGDGASSRAAGMVRAQVCDLGLDRFDDQGRSRIATDPIAFPFPVTGSPGASQTSGRR